MNKISKALAIAAFVFAFAVTGFATTRNRYQVPVDQNGQGDHYALPCTPKYIAAAENTAVTPLLALDEAGIVYWAAITPATAGDYVVFRDSATANTSSTAFAQLEAPTVTASSFIQFEPPMSVVNGLSVNVSSQTTSVTVCVREADGDL